MWTVDGIGWLMAATYFGVIYMILSHHAGVLFFLPVEVYALVKDNYDDLSILACVELIGVWVKLVRRLERYWRLIESLKPHTHTHI